MTPQERPLRVLTFTTVFPSPARPFLGLFVWERLKHVPGVLATVLAPVPWVWGRVPAEELREGIRVYHPRFLYIPGIAKWLDALLLATCSFARMRWLHRQRPFDVIDAHFGYPDSVAAALLAAVFRIPLVITWRGSEEVMARFRLRRLMMSWSLKRATAVIAVSRPLADLAVGLGVAPERVVVIENGVDLARFSIGNRNDARVALGLPLSCRLAISIGHLVPLKGFHRVIDVVANLRQEWPDLHYAIIGGSVPSAERYRDQLFMQARQLGLDDCVHFTGAQPPERVVTWLQAADVLVLDSDREGSPNVVLEALACGTQVVAARVGGVPDLVPRHVGTLYDPGDVVSLQAGLETRLAHPALRSACRQSVEQRSWTSVGKHVFSVLRQASSRGDR